MKKTIKRILLIIAAVFILITGVGLFNLAPLMTMSPAKTGQIPGTTIYAVKNAMGTVYFIKTNSGYILIDTGSDAAKLKASLQEAWISVNDVAWILLTHSDGDHVAGLPLFGNAKIHMNREEFPLINGTIKRSPVSRNSLPSGIAIDGITSLLHGQELSFDGIKIQCIQAPGHTIGSMIYLVDDRYLFTGDVFKVAKGNIKIHPFTMDAKLAGNTIKLLKETIDSSSLILTGHYGYHEKINSDLK